METIEMYRKLKVLSEDAKELDSKLLEINKSFSSCADLVSRMKEVSTKVGKVFALYRELVALMKTEILE